MKKILLPWLFVFVASDVYAQAVLRPSTTGEMCDACRTTCAIASQAICDTCIAANCAVQVGRIAPHGAPYDAWLADYSLPKTIGVIQIEHELHPSNSDSTQHFTNLDLAQDVRSHGFRVLKVWIKNHPFDGDVEPFCYDLWGDSDSRESDWWCETDPLEWVCANDDPCQCSYEATGGRFENMIEFWKTAPVDVILVRFERYGQSDGKCMALTTPPYYAITKKLYELIGWRDITIIFAPWEQDWYPWGCDDGDGDPTNWEAPFEYANPWYSGACIDQCMWPVVPPEIRQSDEWYDYIDQCVEGGEICDECRTTCAIASQAVCDACIETSCDSTPSGTWEECVNSAVQEFGVVRPEDECRTECGLTLVRDRYYGVELEIERRQVEVERARREAYINLGHRPNLRVMTAVTLNRYPNNQRDHEKASGIPMLAERISKLNHRPDLIGLSYWSKGYDPRETLDWISEKTGYPMQRIYIDELGAFERDQVQRFEEYIPVLWDHGVRLINIWMWRQTWCAEDGKQRGLWKQQQPCAGKVSWGDPTDGYYVIRELNRSTR